MFLDYDINLRLLSNIFSILWFKFTAQICHLYKEDPGNGKEKEGIAAIYWEPTMCQSLCLALCFDISKLLPGLFEILCEGWNSNTPHRVDIP